MTRWTYEALERAIAEFGSVVDPSDPKERKRLKLVKAATELFVKQGYRKTSVDEVARRASVSKGTVYLYFKTKGELLLHAIVEEKKQYFKTLRPVLDDALPPAQRLEGWVKAAMGIGLDMPLLSRLMGGDMELVAALEDIPEAAMASGRAIGIDFLSELIDLAAQPHSFSEQEIQEQTQVLVGLAHLGLLLHEEKIRGGLSVERFAEILAKIVVNGIRAQGGDS